MRQAKTFLGTCLWTCRGRLDLGVGGLGSFLGFNGSRLASNSSERVASLCLRFGEWVLTAVGSHAPPQSLSRGAEWY